MLIQLGAHEPVVAHLDVPVDGKAERVREVLRDRLKKDALSLAIIPVADRVHRKQGNAQRKHSGNDQNADELGADS